MKTAQGEHIQGFIEVKLCEQCLTPTDYYIDYPGEEDCAICVTCELAHEEELAQKEQRQKAQAETLAWWNGLTTEERLRRLKQDA